jgi:hypothetical protein
MKRNGVISKFLKRIWIGILWGSFIVLANASDLNITGTRVSAECNKISTQQAFTYFQWAGACPAYSRPEALAFLKNYNIVQDTLPSCQSPDNDLNPPLGETLSQSVPEGYELILSS